MLKNTKLRMTSGLGEVIVDDFNDSSCNDCVFNNCKDGRAHYITCPKDINLKKRLFFRSSIKGSLSICDNKEGTALNFNQMAELIWHNHQGLVEIQRRIQQQEVKRIDEDINVFKHNIESINGESIGEFENAVSVKQLRNKYKEIVNVVEEAIYRRDSSIPSFIARQALNNQRIQTEIVASRLIGGGIRYNTNFTLSNPWNAVMTNVYLLYPLAQKRHLEIKMSQYDTRFNIDYNAIKVASYYILDNAIKYSLENTGIQILFEDSDNTLKIVFRMVSPQILKEEQELIFEKGFRGQNAKLLKSSGSGYGLHCARKILSIVQADLSFLSGSSTMFRNGIEYNTSNEFIVSLKKYL